MSEARTADAGLEAVNAAPAGAAERMLLDCCASPAWARTVSAGRPYQDRAAVAAAADAALAGLPWSELERALAAHPRIGERPAGDARDAGWSRREQAGVDGARPATLAALAAGNEAYERRFGHVYLVSAAGRSGDDLLALLRSRLDNDVATERAVVREELRKIVRLRLDRLLDEAARG
ncbi:MAG TPA: 2-oxo-4-hydroxy-4-carboxy-5-ureidoimidazoline decarboxylase [Mycobacteriales bacterium]|nr:2-oxo-4-hydroxy-4-carboxy-5-ureidoimidazoline decarboxylase [Mycobacteriales bacterium]